MEISVINGSWKSSDKNHLHCGVAVMRLMETYMGCAKWDPGLKKNNVNSLLI